MIEPEHTKVIALTIAAGVSWFSGTIADTIGPDIASKWIERGGTALCVALLIMAVKLLRADNKSRQDRLDSMHDKATDIHLKDIESRIMFANVVEKLADKIDSIKK